jgi:DNA-binding protein H-NS
VLMTKNLNLGSTSLDAMSIDEMWNLHEEIGRILSARLTSEKRELEKRLAQLRIEKEMPRPVSMSRQSKEGRRERRKYPRVFPKYQNPDDPSETWSGRGKQPRWLTTALKTGHTIEEFAISSVGLNKNNHTRQRA